MSYAIDRRNAAIIYIVSKILDIRGREISIEN